MTVVSATYVTREEVKDALDMAETARANRRVDRAIQSATRTVEAILRRRFLPWVGTKYFPWPDIAQGTPWKLWLDFDELVSVTSLVAGGVTIPAADYYLEPANIGPPYNRIEIDLSSSSAFVAGPSSQRAIAVTGVFGYTDDAEVVGVLAGPLANVPTATASVTWSTPYIGVGDLLHIDNERMVITERSMLDTTQNLQAPALTTSSADNAVNVTDGTAFANDEIILIGTERMRVLDIAGNVLTVKRAYDGSVLATHAAPSDIYALTGINLGRAQRGTTIANHLAAAEITRSVVPSPVRDFALALALNQLLQEASGYARVAGSGDNQREISGRGIKALEADARAACGRQLLRRTV